MGQWTPMEGDYAALRNGLDARDLVRSINEIVLPALEAALPPIDSAQITFDPEQFHVPQTVLATMRESLVIALGSTFEKAFRSWLYDCAFHADGEQGNRAIRAEPWDSLKRRFASVRGFDFADLPGARDLDCLVLLGNALRHGAGKSVARLFQEFPQFFADDPPGSMAYFVETDPELLDFHLKIITADLDRLGRAAVDFWDFVAERGEDVVWFRGADTRARNG
ncbi:hypothetical protein [Phenylobacterium sp.]|uniref:hypothetical protein n=1 Tax=Phenylobacterium sp. TaxID=1871053 RepID=UPI0027272092|nr:hypothetical protein [Phenylobacterium sp.]MDO8378183.1 hypothetical protein [Phenylobacterium sp.]